MNILYSRGTQNRHEQYSILTQIIEDGNDVYVKKSASSNKSKVHLNSLINNYTSIKTPANFMLPKPELINDKSIKMPFIEGDNLEKILFLSLKERDDLKILEVFSKIEELINYQKKTINPSGQSTFLDFFGNTYNKNLECSSIGMIDLNFDNFIYKKNIIYVVDYEWYFNNLKIPISYLINRLLYYTFAVKFKDLMYFLPNEDYPIVEVFENYRLPKCIYDKYKSYIKDTNEMLKAEHNFQNKISVVSNKNKFKNKIIKNKIIKTNTPSYVDELYSKTITLENDNNILRTELYSQKKIIENLHIENQKLLDKLLKIKNLPFIKQIIIVRKMINS